MKAETRAGLPIISFADVDAFETWLAAQPPGSPGLWPKLVKKAYGAVGISKTEAIDAALCFGWIDGQLDRYDDAWWLVRFTPRKRAPSRATSGPNSAARERANGTETNPM